ncbi:MAG: DegT/DnrJ/EryC1/StrS family aminotransferase [Patescibacteria group bacterium]
MFYSQNFAPNESGRSLSVLPKAMLSMLFRKSESSHIESIILKSLILPNNPSIPHLSCTTFFSGRSALYHTLKSLNLTKGSEVIVQAFTCTAVVLPILKLGLKPVYIDINHSDLSADISSLTSRITPHTKAIILQRSFGITPQNRAQIIQICKEKELFLIEDAAHGINPKDFEVPKTLKDYALLLSFGRSKQLSSVFGAAIVTPNAALSEKLQKAQKKLKNVSFSLESRCLLYKGLTPGIKWLLNTNPVFGKVTHKLVEVVGLFPKEISSLEKDGYFESNFDAKYPNSLGFILEKELEYLDTDLDQVAQNHKIYEDFLGKFKNKQIAFGMQNDAILRLPMVLISKELRQRVRKKLALSNIHIGDWYVTPIAPKEVNLEAMGYKLGSCPKAEDICNKIINIPLNTNDSQTTKIANELSIVLER